MPREEFSDLSPEQLYENFNQVRHFMSTQVEAEHSDTRDEELYNDWLEKRPRRLDHKVFEALGITQEDLEQHEAEVAEAFRLHDESTMPDEPFESGDPDFGLPFVPQANTTAAFPYAVVAIGKASDAIKEFDGEASGNPDAWKAAGFSARQEFFLELIESGSGIYDLSFVGKYNSIEWHAIQWYFLHAPFGDGEWSCSIQPWLHGAYRVWADDGWFDSKYAGVEMRAHFCLLPFGHPTPKYHDSQTVSELVISEGGENIDKSRWGGWLPNLPKLSPLAAHRQKPHWIILTVTGQVAARGFSLARLDFAKGYTTSGSIEGGSYRETKYGIYCHTATIHW